MSTRFPAEAIKKTITYFYLLSYSPPEKIKAIQTSLASFRKALAESVGMDEASYFTEAIPEVFRRIVAYHEDSREPSQDWVDALSEAAANADKSPQDAYEFQKKMALVARLPQRALPENRLHRRKGCAFCNLPCQYGFFTLVSDPDFSTLQEMLHTETSRTKETQSAIRPVWHFALTHLSQVTDSSGGYAVHKAHLGNLSYCLLMLSMAKSRLALPEKQLKVYQAINQQLIRES